ncbi:hypothetical protein ACFYYH_34260 [Streptomyces sp. NPDC002018]|uniref:hypothetical protein n=1 Tax=Streptomyces sp. NPDC002018 TaxID=3364629 RepID=UPI0036BC4125
MPEEPVAVTNAAEGVTRFGYDGSGRLTSDRITDPTGTTQTASTTSTTGRRPSTPVDPRGYPA